MLFDTRTGDVWHYHFAGRGDENETVAYLGRLTQIGKPLTRPNAKPK
jgi:hypothetical protein